MRELAVPVVVNSLVSHSVNIICRIRVLRTRVIFFLYAVRTKVFYKPRWQTFD